jgi:hypothetical protein
MASAKQGRSRRRQPEPAATDAGLGRLDRDRASSLADEGGAAGAAVESQEIKIEDEEGQGDKIRRKASAVRDKARRPLSRSAARSGSSR